MSSIQNLRTQFSVDGVSFREVDGGLIIVDINNQYGSASVSLHGAQLIDWQPENTQPVVWLSEKAIFEPQKAIRGGIPVCWPWFGAHGEDSSQPAHGFVRTQSWTLQKIVCLQNGATEIQLQYPGHIHSVWKHNYELSLRMVIGDTLQLALQTRNTGNESIIITEALHTYFQISDIHRVSVTGLSTLKYLDKLHNYQQFTQQGSINIEKEIDRIYLNHKGDCVIDDPLWRRKIHIGKLNSLSTVVWNPGSQKSKIMADMSSEGYKTMLCVETANTSTHAVTIKAGECHIMMAQYRVETY